MHRFYVTHRIEGEIVSLSDPAQFHHLKNVLRLKVNDEVVVCDQPGNEYLCLITELQKKEALLTIRGRKAAKTRKMTLTVACAIPKKAKFEEIVDSLTQLGVDGIIPMETERVIVRMDDSKKEARLKRWRQIAQSAAQQSQRNTIPMIEPITNIENVLSRSHDFALKLLPTLSGERKHIPERAFLI